MTASATALAVGPALADPINGSGKPVTPKETDIVGVGSDTIQNVLDQFSFDYNNSHKTGPAAVQLGRPQPEDWPDRQHHHQIRLRKIPRPNGSAPVSRPLDRPTRKTKDKKALLHRLRHGLRAAAPRATRPGDLAASSSSRSARTP